MTRIHYDIDEDLHRAAKVTAAERGQTLKVFIEEAISRVAVPTWPDVYVATELTDAAPPEEGAEPGDDWDLVGLYEMSDGLMVKSILMAAGPLVTSFDIGVTMLEPDELVRPWRHCMIVRGPEVIIGDIEDMRIVGTHGRFTLTNVVMRC